MPFQFLHHKGVLEIEQQKWKKQDCYEPTSVLHMRRSPSPPTSASTLSSSFGGAAVADPSSSRKDEWASDLPPIPSGLVIGRPDDWETIMSESAASPNNPDQSLLRWISGDVDDSSFDFTSNAALFHQSTPPQFLPPVSLPQSIMYQQFDEKPNSQLVMNLQQSQHHPNPNFFMPLQFSFQQEQQQIFQPQPKRHNTGSLDPKPPYPDPFLQNQFAPGLNFVPQARQQQLQHGHAVLDELYRAAEAVGGGDLNNAQAILARLNQQLSPAGKPLLRAAFYFKEALQLLLLHNPPPPRSPPPSDVIFKIGAYKLFSEISPLLQFANFTSNQALLESLDNSNRIHILDFDVGFGAQWASFMQELPKGASSLRITALASPSTHHPVELELMRENLTQFASNIGLTFDLQIVSYDSLDQCSLSLLSSENEALAVNFPIWSSADQPSALRIVKQLSPKIVVSLDRGCDRSDLPFPQHLLQALQSHAHLLESLDACNASPDAVSKIERFILQPRIESAVLERAKMPAGKAIFASAGFKPVAFSNYAETQAECVVRRTPVRGFQVEKRQAALVLCWHGRELISASAWRC